MIKPFKHLGMEEFQKLTPAQREEYLKKEKEYSKELNKQMLANLKYNVQHNVRTS